MKILYLDCTRGVAGDMVMSSLFDLLDCPQDFIAQMNGLLPGAQISSKKIGKKDLIGVKMKILIDREEEISQDIQEKTDYSGLKSEIRYCLERGGKNDIAELLMSLNINQKIKHNVMETYHLIKTSEAKVHGKEMEYIHGSRLGSLDAMIDILGICLLIDRLDPDKIISTPINLGSGFVKYKEKVFAVPAPATKEIIKDLPAYAGKPEAELCTPTGAAIIRHFTQEFKTSPPEASTYGIGFGGKNYNEPTYVKSWLGT